MDFSLVGKDFEDAYSEKNYLLKLRKRAPKNCLIYGSALGSIINAVKSQ
jgi:hypothetical protein